MAKATKKKAKRPALMVPWKGTEYVIPFDEFTARDDALCRQVIGIGIMTVLSSEQPFEICEAAAFLWLHLRRTNPRLAWDEVADDFGVTDMKVRMVEVDNPEAEGGNS